MNQPSVALGIGAAYKKNFTGHTDGPGHGNSFFEARGAFQTVEEQLRRRDDALRAIAEARKAGDRQIHLSGFSRGAGNALLLAQWINHHGVVHPDTREQVAPPGTSIDSATFVDTVPHMHDGHASAVSPRGEIENVPYEDLRIPPNVKFAHHLLAGGETRNTFRHADIEPADPSRTELLRTVIPHATHADVGGMLSANKDARDLAESEAIRALAERGLPFDWAKVLPPKVHNSKLDNLNQYEPKSGLGDYLLRGLYGSSQRNLNPADMVKHRPVGEDDGSPPQ